MNLNILRHSTIYILSNFIVLILPIFLLPILTNYLNPSDYAKISLFTNFGSILVPLVGLSLDSAIQRRAFDEENYKLKEYVWTCLIFEFLLFILGILVSSFFGSIFEKYLHLNSFLVYGVFIYAVSQSINNIFLALIVSKERPILYGVFSFSISLFNLIISIVLVVLFNFGWKGRVFGIIISSSISAVFAFYILNKEGYLIKKHNFEYIKDALKYSLPLVPHTFSWMLLISIDRIFLSNLISLDETGLYTLGYQIGSIMNVISISVNSAYIPWLFKNLKKETYNKNKIVKITYLIIIFIISLSIIYGIIASRIIVYFFNINYLDSSKYVLIISVSYAIQGIYFLFINYLHFYNKTFIVSSISMFTLILHVVISFLFIKLFGTIGAAYAFFCSLTIKLMLSWYFSTFSVKMPWFSIGHIFKKTN